MDVYAIAVLCALLAAQQIFYLWQIQKLVDKLMSRSYTEYATAKVPPIKVEVPADPPEDLRTLQEFSM